MNNETKIDVDVNKRLIKIKCGECQVNNKFKISPYARKHVFKCKNCDMVFEIEKNIIDMFKALFKLNDNVIKIKI